MKHRLLIGFALSLFSLSAPESVTTASAQQVCAGSVDSFCNTSCAVWLATPIRLDAINEIVLVAQDGGVCRQWSYPTVQGVWDVSSIRFAQGGKGPCGVVQQRAEGVHVEAYKYRDLSAMNGMCTEPFLVHVKSRSPELRYYNTTFHYYFCVSQHAQFQDLPQSWPAAVQRYRECIAMKR